MAGPSRQPRGHTRASPREAVPAADRQHDRGPAGAQVRPDRSLTSLSLHQHVLVNVCTALSQGGVIQPGQPISHDHRLAAVLPTGAGFLPGEITVKVETPAAKRGRTTLTVILRGDTMPGARRTARPRAQNRSPGVRNGEDRQTAGAGTGAAAAARAGARQRYRQRAQLPARQRPDSPAAPAVSGAAPSAVHRLPWWPTGLCRGLSRGGRPGAPEGCALEVVEKVVTELGNARCQRCDLDLSTLVRRVAGAW
jgi:hypothetical protein